MELLEQSFGSDLASRYHSLRPSGGTITRAKKPPPSTMRALVGSATEHTFQLIGNVLYEYTDIQARRGSRRDSISLSTVGQGRQSMSLSGPHRALSGGEIEEPLAEGAGADVSSADRCGQVNTIDKDGPDEEGKGSTDLASSIAVSTSPSTAASASVSSSSSSSSSSSVSVSVSASSSASTVPSNLHLTHVYPLVGVVVGVTPPTGSGSGSDEDWYVSIERPDGGPMTALKWDEEKGILVAYKKNTLTLAFTQGDTASAWGAALRANVVRTRGPLTGVCTKTLAVPCHGRSHQDNQQLLLKVAGSANL